MDNTCLTKCIIILLDIIVFIFILFIIVKNMNEE